MIRIVIDARTVVHKRSGIGNTLEALIRHMVPIAEDMHFLLLRHPDAGFSIIEHERVEELRFPGETKSLDTVFRLGRAHDFAGYDLYHTPADIVPLGLRCPWVVTLHDLMWIEARGMASAFLPAQLAYGAWYTWNIRRAVRGARAVIAISRFTADAIARVFPDQAHKVSVVHHGFDPLRYAKERAGPRADLDPLLPRRVRYSLIVGQGSPYKNHLGMVRAFVEAARDQPDHKLVLVRRFSRVDLAMNRLLSRPDVKDKVILLPFVSDEHLLTLYRHARALLFASHYEGFGLPALEAMALGVPVLASTAPAVLEVTGDAALHATSTSHADLVAKMRRLEQDPALRERLIAAGEVRVKELSWRRAAEQTIEVYRRALGRPRRAPEVASSE